MIKSTNNIFIDNIIFEYKVCLISNMDYEDTSTQFFKSFERGDNILLHGPGGVGKTYLIESLVTSLRLGDDPNSFAVTAPTGIAATAIKGVTIHRFFGIRVTNFDSKSESKITEQINLLARTATFNEKNLRVLIIDEISMVGAKLLRIMDRILRNKFNAELPFGGIQCLFSGDFYQLPPVKDDYCCFTDIWDQLNLNIIKLEEPKRYGDLKTFELMLRLRKNVLTEADKEWLLSRKQAYMADEHLSRAIKPVEMSSKNVSIDTMNARELAKIQSKEYLFTAKDSFTIISGQREKQLTIINSILADMMPDIVSIKVGATVMLVRNFAPEVGLVNGRMGIVKHISDDEADPEVIIELMDGNNYAIRPMKFTIETSKFICSRTQMPLKLAWAITSHKAQGMTLDSAVINLADAFADGQVYVAISRIRSIDNLYLKSLSFDRIKVNKRILEKFD